MSDLRFIVELAQFLDIGAKHPYAAGHAGPRDSSDRQPPSHQARLGHLRVHVAEYLMHTKYATQALKGHRSS